MSQLVNQFSQAPVKGQMDLRFNMNVVSCRVKSDESSALVHGQSVKIVDLADGVPTVTAVAADTDDVFGFVSYSNKDQSFAAGDMLEIAALRGNVMYMEASAAIARWARVAVVVSGSKVVTASGTKTVIGRAYDKAATSGDLIRVVIDLPGESYAESAFAQAANVAALAGTLTGTVTGTMADVTADAPATPGGATPTAANVDTGINTALAGLITAVNLQLKELQTKVNAEIAALKAANLQASA